MAFWIILWWFIWFAGFLAWYESEMKKGKRGPASGIEIFTMFISSGFIIVLVLVFLIKSVFQRDR